MSKLPASEETCNVPLHVVEDAHQLHDVITGVSGLLTHPHRTDAVEAARQAAREAQAICARVVAHLDAVASMQHQRERARRELALTQSKIAAVVAGTVRP